MKEKVLKALWWAWMLLPIGLACFVLPIPCLGVWVLITTGDPEALILLMPVIFSGVMYAFYRYAVRCSSFIALHGAAWNLVAWLQLSIFVKYIADTVGPAAFTAGTGWGILGELLVLGGLQCILWLILKIVRQPAKAYIYQRDGV